MYHYRINVPSNGEVLTAQDTVADRIEYFNGSSHYLLFDGMNGTEKRFIMVSDKKTTQTLLSELKDVFEVPVAAEAIDIKTIDRKALKKIHAAKNLMLGMKNFYGNQKILLVTDTNAQLTDKVNAMIGYTKYKEFFKSYAGFIDRTANMRAKCLYNTVLINKSDICLDAHIELLYSLLAAKEVLTEHVVITGDKYEANNNEKENRCVYVIEDTWDIDDYGEYLKASDEVKLLAKIRKSENIYLTSMTVEQYDKLSVLDCFTAAFPNVVTIDELTVLEKLEFIAYIADEYGFTVNKDSFKDSQFLAAATAEKIEAAVRQAIIRKLTTEDKSFCLDISDIDTKTKKIKKISAFDELESLIGLDGVKQTVKEIVAFVKKRGKKSVPCLHMCFRGNPGTGKTSVARVLARIFYEAGVIKENLLVETDRGGLIGMYVGHTAEKTRRKIESALGGILFIDEAYSLFSDSNIDYGHEAVATLVKAMEDKRDEFICILAGYTNEMDSMINMNPGLQDRIQFYIDFPDYDASELLEIFKKQCKDGKYRLSPSAESCLKENLTRLLAAKSQNFSNARIVRKIYERIRMKQALRTSGCTITDVDVHAVFDETDIAGLLNGSTRNPIGFAV